jgi:hypothetical protein
MILVDLFAFRGPLVDCVSGASRAIGLTDSSSMEAAIRRRGPELERTGTPARGSLGAVRE